MTPNEIAKETATATVETFFKLLGRKVRVEDAWETQSFMSAIVHDYQGLYTISTESFRDRAETIGVRVYNFKFEGDGSFDYILAVRTTPELAAKFTQEAIAAYEKELTE